MARFGCGTISKEATHATCWSHDVALDCWQHVVHSYTLLDIFPLVSTSSHPIQFEHSINHSEKGKTNRQIIGRRGMGTRNLIRICSFFYKIFFISCRAVPLKRVLYILQYWFSVIINNRFTYVLYSTNINLYFFGHFIHNKLLISSMWLKLFYCLKLKENNAFLPFFNAIRKEIPFAELNLGINYSFQ